MGGRFIVFDSSADNLVPDDTNSASDVFVRDVVEQTIDLVSVNTAGEQGDGDSNDASISADSRYLAFASSASNLVANDLNGVTDVFVRDLQTGTTQRASVNSAGQEANGPSFDPSVNRFGGGAVFASDATNLVPNDTNMTSDVFSYSPFTGTVERLSVAEDGTEGNGPSYQPFGDAFVSEASNLVSDDRNGVADIFYLAPRGIIRISRSTERIQANGPSSNPMAFGTVIVYESLADNLVTDDTNGVSDVFLTSLRDLYRGGGTTTRVSLSTSGEQGNGPSFAPSVSPTGSFISFTSTADNLVPDDTNGISDIFLRGRGRTELVSVTSSGLQSDGESYRSVTSIDGRFVAFDSSAGNLVPIDPDAPVNVFGTVLCSEFPTRCD